MADHIRSMPARVRKVEGGYELFIPDSVSDETGIADGAPVILNVVGNILLVQEPEFIERARAAEPKYTGPPQVHDPFEPYDPPPGYARVG